MQLSLMPLYVDKKRFFISIIAYSGFSFCPFLELPYYVRYFVGYLEIPDDDIPTFCEYCGSHSCPSFYAVDEWGQGCYTPSKCPKYDVYADPVWYCQICHKPCGDGRNGTCVQFVIDCTCPNYGEQVKAWTCHYCR